MRPRTRTWFAAVSLAAAAGMVLSGCSSESGEKSGDTIKIGAVSSITGGAPFPEVPGAAKAVFDKVNKDGGIDGKKIEYVSEDDGGDPAKAGQAARRLVDEKNVVAVTGGASMVDCSANASLYQQRGVVNVMGTGIEPSCFDSKNIVPVNNGTINGYASLLYYATNQLKAKKICPVILKSPGLTDPYKALIKDWQKKSGTKAAHVDTSVTLGDDPTPAILAVKKAKCDAVVLNPTEPEAVAFMKNVKQQGILDQADWLLLGNAYTEDAAKALAKQDTLGVYANSEFTPFTSKGKDIDQWRSTLTDAKVKRTSLSEGGYVSAQVLVDVLKGIDGDITRESVSKALQDAGKVKNPLMGMPFVYDDADAHNPNRASKMVKATKGGWKTVSDWVKVPA